MSYYIGIDLGTTNSSIAVYDGENVRICKSPEQNDVTPSAMVIDKRGNTYIGKRAYDIAPLYSDNSALLFKRLMGSNTKIKFTSINQEKTPEECSSEVIKTLYGYLPEELRKNPELGTIVTIPASFNQMQKEATMKAAKLAGLEKVALMQEPVAAVMSVLKNHEIDGYFIIYDLGGGTLDVAIAESNAGRVNLLANGGIQMCGGRDIDRAILDNIVFPWLESNYKLPTDYKTNSQYSKLIKLSNLATERAKIELTSKESTNIVLNEIEISTNDENEHEIYIDISLTRKDIFPFIDEKINESVEVIKEVLTKASLSSNDIKSIIFIGGPTNYKPLRDGICEKIGINRTFDVNPMTAVAEGAAIYAESIDWNSSNNSKKDTKGKVVSNFENFDLSFVYISRTSNQRARVIAKINKFISEEYEFQIVNTDNQWSSEKVILKNGATVFLDLPKIGLNKFKVKVFRKNGEIINLPTNLISITKTTATITAITASHSIGIAVKSNNNFSTGIEWLIRAGDNLPKKGSTKFKATETLTPNSDNSINFKLYEGEIEDPITDNRDIGTIRIKGSDIYEIINAGTELICNYEILDSGSIIINISVPTIGVSLDSEDNFYSPQDGQIDYSVISEKIKYDIETLSNRLDDLNKKNINDFSLKLILDKLNRTKKLISNAPDIEKNQEAQEKILEVKKLLAKVRKNHLKEVRTIDLNLITDFYNDYVKCYTRISEHDRFEVLYKTALKDIEKNNNDFESTLDEIRYLNYTVLNRHDWFVIDRFKVAMKSPFNYSDQKLYKELISKGDYYLKINDIESLRDIMIELVKIKISDEYELSLLDEVNIRKS